MADTKKSYLYGPGQEERIDQLMAELQKLHKREEVIAKELRALIYSIEKPR